MSTFCVNCGQPLVPGAAFCGSCGTAVPSAPPTGLPPVAAPSPVGFDNAPRRKVSVGLLAIAVVVALVVAVGAVTLLKSDDDGTGESSGELRGEGPFVVARTVELRRGDAFLATAEPDGDNRLRIAIAAPLEAAQAADEDDLSIFSGGFSFFSDEFPGDCSLNGDTEFFSDGFSDDVDDIECDEPGVYPLIQASSNGEGGSASVAEIAPVDGEYTVFVDADFDTDGGYHLDVQRASAPEGVDPDELFSNSDVESFIEYFESLEDFFCSDRDGDSDNGESGVLMYCEPGALDDLGHGE